MATRKRNNRRLNIKSMCAFAAVSRSGYYSYISKLHHVDQREINDALDFALILEAYKYKNRVKGAKQIKMRLKRSFNTNFNLKKIRRLMKKFGLVCPIRKANPNKAIMKANRSNRTYKNVISRYFKQGVALKTLLTDITYLTYGNGRRAYLSTIKDSSTNMILAYSISDSLEMSFVIDTVKNLIEDYGQIFDMNIIIHSDQGSHYTSLSFQQLLKENGIIQSMSRRGNCWDNAPQESFFGHAKDELHLKECNSYLDLQAEVEDYIYYYNNDRPQWTMNRMTPCEYHQYLTNSNTESLQLPACII